MDAPQGFTVGDQGDRLVEIEQGLLMFSVDALTDTEKHIQKSSLFRGQIQLLHKLHALPEHGVLKSVFVESGKREVSNRSPSFRKLLIVGVK